MKKNFTYGILITLVLVGLMSMDNRTETEKKVMSGEWSLYCQLNSGYTQIDKEKITGFNEISGEWNFTNGYAKNCDIVK